uniref:Choline/carnitine acyltransferase domain-containing protein n=1 Tax=Panagrolaimus sp. JU765 TaxID=591449 RepID=A0AC34RM80_9BILA
MMIVQKRLNTVLPRKLFDLSLTAMAQKSTTKRHIYSKLPKLMPPNLDNTMSTFLEFAEPIQNYTEYQKTKTLLKEFMDSGEGKSLHSMLIERANKLNNWLTPWWLNIAYLEARTPLPIVTSPGVSFPPMEYSGQEGQVDAASKMIQAALNFHHKIFNNELPEDKAGKIPFDMSQYKFLFGTTRVPKKGKDEIVYGCSSEFSKYILVTRNGHTFKFPVYDQNGNILGTDAIGELMREYVIPQSQLRNSRPVNLVSSDDRDNWAAVYERLKQQNPESIEAYEKSLFILSLDSMTESNSDRTRVEEQMRQMLTGGGADENGINRWFDKTININIGYNGYCGLTYEHTPAEGPPIANLMDSMCTDLEKMNFTRESSADPIDIPKELIFNLEPADEDAISAAAERLNRATNDLEIRFLSFLHFGKDVAKLAKVSPDSFIQLAFQVTHYKLHHVLPPTYETATLRKFDEGRTDTIRLPNPESAQFTKAFVDHKENLDAQELTRMFRKAIDAHKNYSVRCMMGNGMDRHLLGLRLIAAENGIKTPKIFLSDAYRRLNHFRLSTSQVPTRFVIPMGFGPSAADCYGICYNPQETAIHFTLTAFNCCKETSAQKFALELARTLNEFKNMLEHAGALRENSKL